LIYAPKLLHFKNLQEEPILLPIKNIHHQYKGLLNNVHMGVSFDDLSGTQRERLFSFLFVDMPRMQSYNINQPETASMSFLRKVAIQQKMPISVQLQFHEKLRQLAQVSYLGLETAMGYIRILRQDK